MQWLYCLPSPLLALMASLFTYAMTACGAAMVFISRRLDQKAITFMTGTAAGIMIAASFFSLLLPAIEYETVLPSFFTITVGFLLGGVFIGISDFFLQKIHVKDEHRSGVLLYGAVTLHNVPEGLAVGVAFACASAGDMQSFFTACLFALGIGIQNFPEGVCVAYSLRGEGASLKRSFFFSQLSGSVEVFAAVAGAFLTTADGIMPWVLSFSAGAMIAVTCSELIPEAFSQNKGLASFGVIVGFAIMMVLDLAL